MWTSSRQPIINVNLLLKIALIGFLSFAYIEKSHSDIAFFGEESCGENYSGAIAQMYFLTTKPKDFFALNAKYAGSFNDKGEYVPDPRWTIEIKKFTDAYNRPQSDYRRFLDAWFELNKPLVDKLESRASASKNCRLQFQLYGKITHGDVIKLENELSSYRNKPFIKAYLNSSGGEVSAAIAIGKILRDHYGVVDVSDRYTGSKDVRCFSSCVLVYAAGIAKQIGLNFSTGNWHPIGVHQHFLPREAVEAMTVEEGLKLIRKTKGEISEYLQYLGASEELITLSASADSTSIRVLSEYELKKYLPFIVSEYAAILPIKISQARTSAFNLFSQSMNLSYQRLGPDAALSELIEEAHQIIAANNELFKWSVGPEYEINTGIHYQN